MTNFDFMPYVNALLPITSRVRTDVTATKIKDGTSVWTKESLTPPRLIRHFENKKPRGVCPIKAGQNVTKVALLDFDSHGGETDFDAMMLAADTVARWFLANGLVAIPFRSSGGRGIHLYFLWNEEQDAYSVRQTIMTLLADIGMKNGTNGVIRNEVEIFPKQDSVPVGGYGNQFILPLTGQSVPIDLELGLVMDREDVLTMEWPVSVDIPKQDKPVREIVSVVPSDDLAPLIGYVSALDPDCGYDEWVKVGMALHYACAGDDDGLSIWDEWSSQGSKYPGPEILANKWLSFNDNRDAPITQNSLMMMARDAGYTGDIEADFDIIEDEAIDAIMSTNAAIDHNAGNVASATATNIPQVAIADNSRPNFNYNKAGEIIANAGNVLKALRRAHICGMTIQRDVFRDEIMFRKEGGNWQQFTDPDYMRLREKLERGGFQTIGRELIRDAVAEVADTNRFDSAVYWLENDVPQWDGIDRIENFMHDYMGAVDDAYTRSVGMYLWTGLAGRILQPGCKADMVAIFAGPQGVGKSTAVTAIVPQAELACEISFTEKDDDLARKMRGHMIAEIGELRGLHSRELEAIKAFIVRTHEKWTPKFKEFTTTFARRLMFIGTTNKDEFLADETGNRRWLPVTVAVTKPMCDVPAIRRDRAQLWAEARDRFYAEGVMFRDAQALAASQHDAFMIHDTWQDIIENWLCEKDMDGTCPADAGFIRAGDVLRYSLNFDSKNIKASDEWRVGKVLRKLGYEKKVRRVEGKNTKVWVLDATPEHE